MEFLNQFKWYRWLTGGIWYNNRYSPLCPSFIWERNRGKSSIILGESVTVIKVEEYRTEFTKLKKLNI